MRQIQPGVIFYLPEENTLEKEVQVPGEEVGHQVLHYEEQRDVAGGGDCCERRGFLL